MQTLCESIYLLDHVLHFVVALGGLCSGNGDSEKGKHAQEEGNAIDNSGKQDLPDRNTEQVIKETASNQRNKFNKKLAKRLVMIRRTRAKLRRLGVQEAVMASMFRS